MAMTNERKLLLGALVAGILALIFHFAYLSSVSETRRATKQYAVAKEFIRAGTEVKKTDYVVMSVTPNISALLKNNFFEVSELNRLKSTWAVLDIEKGDLISKTALGTEKDRLFTPSDLRPGERAISIGVDEQSSLGYRLHPADRIDIYKVDDGEVIFRMDNVEIAAVGAVSRSDQGMYRTVTLRVAEDDAIRIGAADQGGKFKVAVRNPEQ